MTRKEQRASLAATLSGSLRAQAHRRAENEAYDTASRVAHAAWVKQVESLPEGSSLRLSEEAWGLAQFKLSAAYGGGLLPAAEYDSRRTLLQELQQEGAQSEADWQRECEARIAKLNADAAARKEAKIVERAAAFNLHFGNDR